MRYSFQSERIKKEIILPEIFRSFPELRTGMSTKIGGVLNSQFPNNLSFKVGDDPAVVKINRQAFFSELGILEGQLAIPLQCHSNIVKRIEGPGEYDDCDALVTNTKNVALIITVADCVPVLVFDPANKAVGAIHAGWRGSAAKICRETIIKMKQEFNSDPSNLIAYIGPAAGGCCYEVGEEVAVLFDNKIVNYHSGRKFIDLKIENEFQLEKAGIRTDHIEVSKYCSICENKLFHSFRREGKKAGRMMALICLAA